ncbi:MAG: hypothetical protein RSA89_00765 [Raoultibacter sp.]
MENFYAYLDREMGLKTTVNPWSDAEKLPVFLSHAAKYCLCLSDGVHYITAEIEEAEASLPDLKRIPSQLARRTTLPVAIVANLDARQRKALVQQGIPFIVPGRQAYLPFLGFIANTARALRVLGKRLSPSAQAALLALIAHPEIRVAGQLRELMKMPSSSVSRSLDELSRRRLIAKSKEGREVVISYDLGKNALLKKALPYLASPVVRTFFARKGDFVSDLTLAGESALSKRSMIGEPAIACYAVSRKNLDNYEFDEVQEGELSDADTVQIQVWSYDPLIAGQQGIDDVSLALSLIEEDDERINGQLDILFDEEDLWQ